MAVNSAVKKASLGQLPWVRLLLLAILITLQAQLWWGQGSLAELKQLSQALDQQRLINAQLSVRNEQLRAQVELLRHSDEAIEGRARSELDLVRPNETLYRIIDRSDQAKSNDDTQ